MKFELDKIARKSLVGIKPYSTARDEFMGTASIFLDANENPFNSNYNRYPDPNQSKLKEAIAKLKNVEEDQIILGNGSDEIIDLLFKAFCEPMIDNVIIPQPTYGMYQVCADINNIEARLPALSVNFDLDFEAVFESVNPQTKLIFLCSPNNPSGNLLSEETIKKLLNAFSGLIIIDEAYIDFTEPKSFLQYLDTHPNLIVLQTFSKAWGLAGLRLGVGYASKEVIKLLKKIKPPYNINTVTQEIALDALLDPKKKDQQVNSIINERESLKKKLSSFSFVKKIYPSDANFLLALMDNAKDCYEYLLSKGIIVRNRSSAINCENCLRITVGLKNENELLIGALTEYEKSIVY